MKRSLQSVISVILAWALVALLLPAAPVWAATKEEATQSKIDAIIAAMPPLGSDYQKALYLHDYIVNHVVYQSGSNDQTAYGALVEGKAVCAGYADAYLRLLKAVGIESTVITGEANNGLETESHAWNMVWLDGACYFTDVTWDDPISSTGDMLSHAYFNLTMEQMALDHFADSEFDDILPDSCNHTGMDYYTMSAYPGSGIGIVQADTAIETVAAYFVCTGYDGEEVIYTCDLRFDGVDAEQWYTANYAALGAALGLNGFSLSISGVGDAYTMTFQGSGSPDHIHDDPLELVTGRSATCTEAGIADYFACSGCGAGYYDADGLYPVPDSEALELPATGHQDQNGDNRCDTCSTQLAQDPPPTTRPTEPSTAPSTKPTEPSTDSSTAPTMQPTQPSTQPTEPSAEATTPPTTDPTTPPSTAPSTEATAQPTESTAGTTVPTINPSETPTETVTAPSDAPGTAPTQATEPDDTPSEPSASASQGTTSAQPEPSGTQGTTATEEPAEDPVSMGDIRVYIAIGAIALIAVAVIVVKKRKG